MRGAAGFNGGSIVSSSLPPFPRWHAFSLSISGCRKSDVGPPMTTTDASAGISCCNSTSFSAVKLSDPSSCARPENPDPSEVVRARLSLREVDLVRLALHDLDQGVGQILFVVCRDALGTALVLEDDRSESLSFRRSASAGRFSGSMT